MNELKLQPKLFMLLLGCKPNGRNTEQHDTLFAIGSSLKDVVPQILGFWPDAGKIHIDGWREVKNVGGYIVTVTGITDEKITDNGKLFFINLGGYKQNEFDEFHYKLLTVALNKSDAIHRSKQTAFYKHTGFKGAESHIDDKYGVDVDDIYEISDILPKETKSQFKINIEKKINEDAEDEIHLGYFKLNDL
ncbi:MAG: DUF1543 domain-containing protein [Ferruginibacter sp.]